MTTPELEKEKYYRYEERLGILCGTAEPTSEQMEIARKEADATVTELSPSNDVDS